MSNPFEWWTKPSEISVHFKGLNQAQRVKQVKEQNKLFNLSRNSTGRLIPAEQKAQHEK
jgi:hypothetical protein